MTKRTQTALELEAKEESLSALLLQMDDYAPLIPDAVTDYYLAKGGLSTDDVRLKRLLALACQKFISDVALDAMQFAKVRQQAAIKERKGAGADAKGKLDKKTVLTMDDLSNAMQEHGVNIKKPEYFL